VLLQYNSYIARTAMATAVDTDQCTRSLLQLIENPALRKQMGTAGLARAREEFDWRHIIGRYEALWRELAERRKTDAEVAPRRKGSPAHPLAIDPFQLFAHYATEPLKKETRLQPGLESHEDSIVALNADWMMSFGGDSRLPVDDWLQLVSHLQMQGETTIGDLLTIYAGREVQLWRTIGYLLKVDILRIKT
jgi:hypothetical protein